MPTRGKLYDHWKNAPVDEDDELREIEFDHWERQLKELAQAARELEDIGAD